MLQFFFDIVKCILVFTAFFLSYEQQLYLGIKHYIFSILFRYVIYFILSSSSSFFCLFSSTKEK